MKYKILAKRVAMPLLIAMLLTPQLGIVYSESLEEQLNSNQQKVQQQQEKKAEAQQRIEQFSTQLKIVQDQLAVATKALQQIEAQRRQKESEIAKNELLLKQAQARYDKRMVILKNRVRDIYINGKLSYLDVILGAKNFNDFINRVEFLKRIIDSDLELINSIKEEREAIERTKIALENDRKRIVELQKEAVAKQAVIKEKEAEQAALLRKAQYDKSVAMEALEELEASSNEIKRQIQAREAARKSTPTSTSSEVVHGSGRFIWPVNGPITSPFGWRTHPIYGRQILHSGIDIGVPTGTVIHAADSGTVILAGWVSGYGYTVVIDHGNGYSTLYAHNSELIVSSGQDVSQGQPIAYAGSTGNSTGPHCHFEVRVNGEPQNPLNYL